MKEITQDIDRIYNEFKELGKFLQGNGEYSYITTINDHNRKILLLSIASFFERKITDRISEYVERQGQPLLVHVIQQKVLNRKYHTLFVWENNKLPAKNVNGFLSIFGPDFKTYMENEIKKISEITQGMENFLLLGFLRNQLVHDDFASNTVQGKTMEEMYSLFNPADRFIDFIFEKLFLYN